MALGHVRLAVDSGVAGRAGAGVAALARVGAGGAVQAGLVVGAVVEVCEGAERAEGNNLSHGLTSNRGQARRWIPIYLFLALSNTAVVGSQGAGEMREG